jgi:hypothetical protein
LAVALTVVGCQNYDDQFDELSDQITALSSTVQGLSSVADQITALSNTVNGLATAASVSGLQGDITTIKAAVDALTASLADVATAADLGIISSTLADVQADVKELLSANAVINQNITINNVATLEYVESLISTDADDPNVIVNGEITIEVDETDFDATHLPRIQAVSDKFATSLKTVTLTNTYSPTTVLSLANLAFVDQDLVIDGNTTIADGDSSNDKLRTVTGDLTISNVTGDIDLSLLTSADDITVPEAITALKMGAVTAASLSTAGSAKGMLNLATATIIDGGKSSVATLVAPKATDIDITAAATLTVQAAKAATIDIGGTALTGDMSITASSATVVKAVKVKSVNGTITTGALAELHLTALTSTATMTSGAVVMDLSALASQKASTTIVLTKIKNFNAPKLVVSEIVSLTEATDVTVKNHSQGDTRTGSLIYGLAIKNLTISELGTKDKFEVTTSATVLPALVSVNATGKAAASGPFITNQTNTVSVTSNVLTTLSTAGTIDRVSLHKAAKLTSLTSAGYTRLYSLTGAALLESVDMGHDHIEGSDAATLNIQNAAKLTSLAPSALDEVGHVTITGLPKMTTLNLSSMKTLPQLGAYNINISDTGLTGSYAIATEITTTTTIYNDAIYSDDLLTLKPYMDLSAASALVTYTFLGGIISATTTKTYDSSGAVAVTGTNTESLDSQVRRYNNSSSKVTMTFSGKLYSQGRMNDSHFKYVVAE